jgi:hypothetical protein
MVQDRLTESVLRRLRELGLPESLIELDEFRDPFLRQGWVMFVRDRDAIADVHLCEPRTGVEPPAKRR